MCYTRRDRSSEEEARSRLRTEEPTRAPRREADIRSDGQQQQKEKPLTEKVKEMVGVR